MPSIGEYSWYIRDGVFVRSPVRFDGVALSDKDRRDAEQDWIASHREKDNAAKGATAGTPAAPMPTSDAGAMDTLMRATREPDFVSAAYFLHLRFESGHYAFVGPETFEGRSVLRIEYYPSRLYNDDHDDHDGAPADAKAADTKPPDAKPTDAKPADAKPSNDEDARIERQMNKVALVTLWVEPTEHQIVKYRLDNMPMAFLPGKSLIRVNGFGATMTMSQPFPGVWLPHGIDASGTITLANGSFDAHYEVAYQNYRLAEVKARIQ